MTSLNHLIVTRKKTQRGETRIQGAEVDHMEEERTMIEETMIEETTIEVITEEGEIMIDQDIKERIHLILRDLMIASKKENLVIRKNLITREKAVVINKEIDLIIGMMIEVEIEEEIEEEGDGEDLETIRIEVEEATEDSEVAIEEADSKEEETMGEEEAEEEETLKIRSQKSLSMMMLLSRRVLSYSKLYLEVLAMDRLVIKNLLISMETCTNIVVTNNLNLNIGQEMFKVFPNNNQSKGLKAHKLSKLLLKIIE